MSRALLAGLVGLLALVPGAADGARAPGRGGLVEVVVLLKTPPLALAHTGRFEASTHASRLSLRAAASVAYLRRLSADQRVLEQRIRAAVPSVRVSWRYRVTLDGLAVVVRRRDVGRLAALAGVAALYPSVRYHARLDRSPGVIGAPQLWGPTLASAGQGMKIGIIDQGVDQTHPFFNPAGFSYPPGFPKGQIAYTTPKVIVARVFAPPLRSAGAGKAMTIPFDPADSHGTHVAGIAAGDFGVKATVGGQRRRLSGVAPKAYIGNYRALTVPTPDFATDGNAPEIAAAIEAAVNDGMDVINLSLGEPEVEPSRDLVVQAIDGAAAAGVVPVIAAGNDFGDFGVGSVGSPGSADGAITVAASTKTDEIADFSSSGPAPVSLRLKPDVTAPGVTIVSSMPADFGLWRPLNGTSMAAPHVAGAAALLRQRHPAWTVDELKSALVQTGAPVYTNGSHRDETSVLREGGGLVDLPRADAPLLFASPSSVSLGLLQTGQSVSRRISLADAGGGAGTWSVSLSQQVSHPAVTLGVPATVSVPGELDLSAVAAGSAGGLDLTGFVVLRRGSDVRRIPYWVSVSAAALASEPHRMISGAGVYRGDTSGKPALVSAYRYPRGGERLPGPEQVFRFVLTRPAANFGAAVVAGAAGIQPVVVAAGDESRLVGYTGLPVYLNPYTSRFGSAVRVAGAVRPAPGAYDVVIDSTGAGGPFAFRFWVDDVTPPTLRLLTPRLARGAELTLSALDAGAGVDPASIAVKIDGAAVRARYSARAGRITVTSGTLGPGRHKLTVVAADFQEAKNMEDVPYILPNTAVLRTTFVVP